MIKYKAMTSYETLKTGKKAIQYFVEKTKKKLRLIDPWERCHEDWKGSETKLQIEMRSFNKEKMIQINFYTLRMLNKTKEVQCGECGKYHRVRGEPKPDFDYESHFIIHEREAVLLRDMLNEHLDGKTFNRPRFVPTKEEVNDLIN